MTMSVNWLSVVLHTINPMTSTKWVTSFSWIFHFSMKDFSKKIYEIFFLSNARCFRGIWNSVQLILGGQNARTRVRLLYFLEITSPKLLYSIYLTKLVLHLNTSIAGIHLHSFTFTTSLELIYLNCLT